MYHDTIQCLVRPSPYSEDMTESQQYLALKVEGFVAVGVNAKSLIGILDHPSTLPHFEVAQRQILV